MNEGKRTQRRAKTVAGADVGTRPLVVPILIALNVAVFVLTAVQAGSVVSNDSSLSFEIGVLWPPVVASGEWWRLLTSGFLHFGPIHLISNMAGLFIIGRDLEAVLGRARFLALYLVSLFGGSTAVFLWESTDTATAGASGAVFGLAGAWVVSYVRRKQPVGLVAGIVVLMIISSFRVPDISWLGHLGGLTAGALVALGLFYPPRNVRTQVQVATVVGLLVVMLALVVFRDGQLIPYECTYDGRMRCFAPLGA